MSRAAVMVVLVCGGLAFFLGREEARGTFDAWHRPLWGLVAGDRRPAPVVMVEMRRGDLPFESWPPAPLDYALVFESLVRREPGAVAVSALLGWREVDSMDAATLAERIALLPRGVLACTLELGSSDAADGPPAAVPLAVLPRVSGDAGRIPEFSGAGQIPHDAVRGSKALGFTRIELGAEPAAGESSINIPLLARRGGEVVPSLLLQSLMAWKGRSPAEVSVELGRRIVVADDLMLPIDETGGFAVWFHLSPALRRVAAGSLLLDMEQDGKLLASQPAEAEALSAMRGGLVVLGETGDGTARFGVGRAGEWTESEVLAHGLAAALSGRHVREVPVRWQWGVWAALIAAGAGLTAVSRLAAAGFAVAGAVFIALSVATAFLLGRWWMPPLPPLILWGLAGSLVLLLGTPAVAGIREDAPATDSLIDSESPAAGATEPGTGASDADSATVTDPVEEELIPDADDPGDAADEISPPPSAG